jgi:hypothetical protein
MDVILDTNIYYSLLLSQGRELFSSTPFLELCEYLRRTKSKLIIPAPVFEEITNKYSEIIKQHTKEVQDSWVSLQHKSFQKVGDITLDPPTPDEQLKAFTEKLLNPGQGFEVKVLANYEGVSLSEVVRRGVKRIPPANKKGEELRDVITWLFVLKHAKDQNCAIAFVAQDGHFKGEGDKLHPDLDSDLSFYDVAIQFHTSINQFVKDNSLEKSAADAQEIAALIKEGRISDLLVERIGRLELTNIMVEETKFTNATKYKIADDSFYVEAEYSVGIRYSEYTAQMNLFSTNAVSGFNALQPAPEVISPGLFHRIGQSISLSELAKPQPIGTQTNYHVVITPVFSFRLVGGVVESLEILQMGRILETTKLSEVPIFGATLSPMIGIPQF